MPSIASSDSGVQSGDKSLTTASGQPLWRALLHDRGLSDATIDHFRIHPDMAGWLYPVAPEVPAERWKAFPRARGAKYCWQPRKPDGVTFYDPHGDLRERIAAQGGRSFWPPASRTSISRIPSRMVSTKRRSFL